MRKLPRPFAGKDAFLMAICTLLNDKNFNLVSSYVGGGIPYEFQTAAGVIDLATSCPSKDLPTLVINLNSPVGICTLIYEPDKVPVVLGDTGGYIDEFLNTRTDSLIKPGYPCSEQTLSKLLTLFVEQFGVPRGFYHLVGDGTRHKLTKPRVIYAIKNLRYLYAEFGSADDPILHVQWENSLVVVTRYKQGILPKSTVHTKHF